MQCLSETREKVSVIIIGAGGHAKVIVDIIIQNGIYDIAGLIDHKGNKGFWGIPVIGTDQDLQKIYDSGIRYAFVALGSNALRKKISMMAEAIGFQLINVISKNAILSEHCKIGKGIVIMPGAVVNADTAIGDGCIVNTNSSLDHDSILGNYVHIAPGVNIAGKVRVGNLTFVGVGSRVIDGITIGKNVIVGSGAVIINDVDDTCTVVGVPAKKIK